MLLGWFQRWNFGQAHYNWPDPYYCTVRFSSTMVHCLHMHCSSYYSNQGPLHPGPWSLPLMKQKDGGTSGSSRMGRMLMDAHIICHCLALRSMVKWRVCQIRILVSSPLLDCNAVLSLLQGRKQRKLKLLCRKWESIPVTMYASLLLYAYFWMLWTVTATFAQQNLFNQTTICTCVVHIKCFVKSHYILVSHHLPPYHFAKYIVSFKFI